jgi:hypothetical protein
MAKSISLRSGVELGVVPTHVKFVGGLVPEAGGKLPRGASGDLVVVAEMEGLVARSPVAIASVQITVFPGADPGDLDELVTGLRGLGLEVYIILMVGGADPMKPSDEDKVAGMLVAGLEVAKKYGVKQVASTSIEEWMQPGAKPKTGAEFDAAVEQDVRVHLRACEEAGLGSSGIECWHFEFLRGGEFQTFTDIEKAWHLVQAANRALGKTFFKVMVDAAHCGDSGLTIPQNEELIRKIAAAGELGMFHASAKTTRGCLSTDDGWIGALLAACARTGALEQVFVEVFHHEDPALQGLRDLDPGHGIDTRDGRSYSDVVLDGLEGTARRLNNLAARGILEA